jgi:outer membrane protein assembly factor BamA
MAVSSYLMAVCALIAPLHAQPLHPAPTREAEIIAQQEAKARNLKPDVNTGPERTLLRLREDHLLDRIFSGYKGLSLRFGGLATGGGFAIGPAWTKDNLLQERLKLAALAQVSTRGYQKLDFLIEGNRLPSARTFGSIYAVHHNYPELQFYGSGPDSQKTGRSNFRLEDTAIDGTFGVRPLPKLSLGITAGYLQNNVGPGNSRRWISAEKQFTPQQAIGIGHQADFTRFGGYLQLDLRDESSRRGGNYFAQFSRFEDQTLRSHDFNRIDIEAQQYLSFFNERRTLALRGRVSITDPRPGQTVPFYLQPVLGGSDTLRGYRAFRFYGNNSLLMNAEYRYEVFSGLDMAIFADAGKVTNRPGRINFGNLESSIGFGFRFNAHNRVFMRIDTGFSNEGFQVWFKFNPLFSRGPVRTSSSQGDY